MEHKAVNFIIQGMQRDLNVARYDQNFAYENMNIRLTAMNDNTLLAITNEKGEFEISFKIPEKTPHINQYTLYIRGAKTKILDKEVEDIPEGVEIIAYDFDLTLKDGMYTASAYVKNMTLESGLHRP